MLNKTIGKILLIQFCVLTIAPVLHAEKTCQLCEDIRARNRQNPSSGYTYYEDYLKAQEGQKQAPAEKKEQE